MWVFLFDKMTPSFVFFSTQFIMFFFCGMDSFLYEVSIMSVEPNLPDIEMLCSWFLNYAHSCAHICMVVFVWVQGIPLHMLSLCRP